MKWLSLGYTLPARYLVVALLLIAPASAMAQQKLSGQWFEVDSSWQFSAQLGQEIDAPSVSGGDFVFAASIEISEQDSTLVIDFKNASSLGRFHHYITDQTGNMVAEAQGGIESTTSNPFFLRHGREFNLPPGDYQLTTHLSSPYFIAQPEPYRDTLENYRGAVRWGNLITLVSLGVLISLGLYYTILAMARPRMTEIMYASFIWMNVIYNGGALLLTPQLLGVHWYYLVGGPILLSNFAYILFAKHLLQIKADTHPWLTKLATIFLSIMLGLLLLALFNPNLVIESARYGVGLMMLYGLIAALVRAFEGYKIAYFYLVAIAAFFVIGSIAISSKSLDGVYTIYVEHIGLLAVTVEVLLIGLVLAYQFAEVYREKEHSLALAKHNLDIAHRDGLTNLPNRYALDLALPDLPEGGMLTLLDMDNLKLYNDVYGHKRGDELLQMFSTKLAEKLNQVGVLYRMGGDEFAILTSNKQFENDVEAAITETIGHLRYSGFEKAGVSYGSAYVEEVKNMDRLRTLADKRMYQNKRGNKHEWSAQAYAS